MSFKIIYGTPILKVKMPNHEEILENFLPFIEDENNFDFSTSWDCNCGTTINNLEKNEIFPWHLFFENIGPILDEYSSKIGLSNEAKIKMSGHAWANTYTKDQFQEVHQHQNKNILISCAYMLKLPKDSAEFSFYHSNYNVFPAHLNYYFDDHSPFSGSTIKPPLDEGDIIFFPSSTSHYVSSHNSTELRASISANFNIN